MGKRRDKASILAFGVWMALFVLGISVQMDVVQAKKQVKVNSIKIKDASKGLLINRKEKKKLKLQVKPSKVPQKDLKWKSSDKSVVSVSSRGVIKGKKYGTAYISVKVKGNAKKKAKIKVQVGQKVKKVAVAATNMMMDVKTEAVLPVSVQPVNATYAKLRFTSSNKKVASVSKEGLIKAHREGEAVITAASTDGTKKKAVCKVKVQVPSQSVALETEISPLRVNVGGTVEIDAHVKPSNATNRSVNYISSNPSVARISKSGTVTGIKPGTTVLEAKAADGRSSASVKVEVYELEVRNRKMIAHRGYSTKAPENTLAAFRLAVESGFWGVECDVRKTWDGRYVIIHPVIELKEAYQLDDIDEIVSIVDEYGLLDRTIFISMYQDNLLFLQSLGVLKEGQLQYIYGAEERNKVVEIGTEELEWCVKNKIDLDARYNLLTKSAVAYMHRGGRIVNAWTVNELSEAYEMFRDYGIDMLTTEKMLAR